MQCLHLHLIWDYIIYFRVYDRTDALSGELFILEME